MPQITQYYITDTVSEVADPAYVKQVSPLISVAALNDAKFWDNDQAGRNAAMSTLNAAYPTSPPRFVGGHRPKP